MPAITAVRFAPDEIVRVLRAGTVELTERISLALDHGLVCWGIVADAPVPISLHWTSPFPQRARPAADPAITSDSPEPLPADAAPTLRLGNSVNGLTVVACAGRVHRTSAPGSPGSVCVAEGDRMLRLVFAGGTLAGEVQRGEEAFARRRLRAFRQDRILHARRLEQRLTALESVDAMLDRALHWSKVRLDAAVSEIAGRGRMPRMPGQDGSVAAACEIAGAALVTGDREIALDLLRALARSGTDGSDRAAIGRLVQQYLAWTGDQAAIDRLDLGVTGGSGFPEMKPPAWDDSVLIRSVSGCRPEAEASSSRLLRAVVSGLWGVEPDAPNESVSVRPALPAAWPEMALRRLRVGGTLLDLRLRRRPGRLVLRVELLQGPRLRLSVELPPAYPVSQVTLDDDAMGGVRATFEVAQSHEVSFYLTESEK